VDAGSPASATPSSCKVDTTAPHAQSGGRGRAQTRAPGRLRADARVVVWEGANARHLEPGRFPDGPSLATIDVSFISLDKVLPAVSACLVAPAEIVALVKPQFEVGRGQVGKGGVVRAWDARRDVVRGVAVAAARLGLATLGVAPSVLHGPKGNREVFLHLARDPGPRVPLEGDTLEAALAAAVPAEGRPAGARAERGRQ